MIEQTFRFGDNEGLIGTVTLPEDGRRADVAVLWLNSGVIPRVGPHRLHVRLARAVARGYEQLPRSQKRLPLV